MKAYAFLVAYGLLAVALVYAAIWAMSIYGMVAP
jgi:hypothetical protein